MVYTCTRCLYTFSLKGDIELCLDCGSPDVRHATEDEITEFKRNKKRAGSDKGARQSQPVSQ